jgi:hypothetical protein
VKRKEQFIRIIQTNREKLVGLGVESIGLFGSTVRGEDRADSDLDVLVTFASGKKTLDSFLGVSDLLEQAFDCPVDLMTPESLSRHFGPRILKETEHVALAS